MTKNVTRHSIYRRHAALPTLGNEPEEAQTALTRREVASAQAQRPQTVYWHSARPLILLRRPKMRCSLDFVSDAFTDGRQFRALAVVDDFTCECMVLVTETYLSGVQLAREMDAVITKRGKPKSIAFDNGCIETFGGKLRAECVNAHWFFTLADAREKLEARRKYYKKIIHVA